MWVAVALALGLAAAGISEAQLTYSSGWGVKRALTYSDGWGVKRSAGSIPETCHDGFVRRAEELQRLHEESLRRLTACSDGQALEPHQPPQHHGDDHHATP